MAHPAGLVLGLDIGGTSTRVLVADTNGRREGTGRGPGANVTSHGADKSLDALSTALRVALTGLDPARVQAAVIGTAGPENFTQPEVAAGFDQIWRDLGLRCDYEITDDARVAFVAGTAEPDGTLLLCGTGAIAARFEQQRRVHTVDGHGWLLGDLGSGFWLGREAVRTTLDVLARHERPGPLGRAVLAALLTPRGDEADPAGAALERLSTSTDYRALADRIVLNVHQQPPIALAELAPLVSDNAAGDPDATRVLERAADHLLASASTVRTTDGTPMVLAGSLLTSDTPLRRLLEPRLVEQWPKATISAARDGAAGAAWLAASRLLGPGSTASVELHSRMVAPTA
ncbi:N-acetylglucosamine kinase [Phytoactinopolyspora limicola]|uniref:N-acetylglucosamine kinase n=1 Tax=Phytoactinopolyspora limicola TaxID=2715536 RepID=UPI001409BCCF|nr:BadF/BadG/BcrA/BcrD ATPase family protein [Phytoactinopolyspora limicola]